MNFKGRSIQNARVIFIVITFLLSATHLFNPCVADARYEKPPTLDVKGLLKPDQVKGPHHTVGRKVKNDGMFNHYTVTSDFGDFNPPSTLDVTLLVHEINVIAEMKKIETDDTVVEAFKESADDTLEGVKHLFDDPKGTFEAAGEGLTGLFKTAKGTFRKRKVTDAEDSRIEQLVGLSKTKGKIATKYGVNVYTRNQVLQEELDRLARADFAGGLGLSLAKAVIPGAGGLLLTTSETARLLNETINTTPASKLWLQNKEKLLAMRIDADTVELFLNQPVFSPARQSVMVTALEKLDGVENRDLFLKVALQASTFDMAVVIGRIAVMSAGYHQNVNKLQHFKAFARTCYAVNHDGAVVLFLPTDYIIWSKMLSDDVGDLMSRHKGAGFELWTLGSLSEKAQSQLRAKGWNIESGVNERLNIKDK